MTLKRIGDIVAISTPEGKYVAFHARNLEVASVDIDAWNAMDLPYSTIDDNSLRARQEIEIWNHESNASTKSGHIDFGIRHITINTTQLCNLGCKYCAAGGNGSYGDPVKKISIEKTLPQLKYLLEKVPRGSSFSVHFLGGEPLVYPQAIKDISDYVQQIATQKDIQIHFVITTNATLINPEIIELLSSLKCKVQVSLDGPPEINDRQRVTKAGSGSSNMTLRGLGQLVENRRHLSSIGISATFDRNNLAVVEAYKYFSDMNVDWYDFTFSFTEQDEKSNDLFIEQMNEVAQLAWEKGGEKELRKIETFNHYFKILDEQQRVENYCGAGKTSLMIDARNQMYTCPWVVGNKNEIVGQDNYLDENKLSEYQNPLIEMNSCQNCWARYLCGGGCMFTHKNKTGSKHQVSNDFCKRTRSLIALAIVYYERSRS